MTGILISLGRLSVRELWISYQLLVIVAVLAIVGLLAPLAGVWLPRYLDPSAPVAATTQALGWYGVALAGASVLVAGMAARTIAADRARGSAAWVVSAPVSRGTFFVGWMIGVATPVAGGMLLSAVTAWFTIASLGAAADPARFAAASVAAGAYLIAAATIGLASGSKLDRGRATAVAAGIVLALAVAAWLAPFVAWLPPAATVRLVDIVVDPAALGAAVQLVGASIVLAGVAGYAGAALIGRAEL